MAVRRIAEPEGGSGPHASAVAPSAIADVLPIDTSATSQEVRQWNRKTQLHPSTALSEAVRLDKITKSDVVRYLNLRRTQMTGNPGHKNRRQVSESTVRRERGLLQSIFERAIDEGYDIRNPFRGIKRGKDKPRTRVLTLDEESLLLEALHQRFQRFVRFALGTGCRLDEIRGIAPERDIDWLRGTVHVTGKFRKERDVPMQPDARAALEEQLEQEGKLWKQNPQRLREVLAEGCARAKIPTITPHVLRHTFGTRWLQAGGEIYKLSKILGHSSVAVTEAHYAHLLKEDLVAASQQAKIPVAPRSAQGSQDGGAWLRLEEGGVWNGWRLEGHTA